MELYAILRRNLATPDELEAVDQRSQAELDRRADEVRKIRTYVFEEDDGTLGTICLYETEDPQVIWEHSRDTGIRADDVRKVSAIDVHRNDPERLAT